MLELNEIFVPVDFSGASRTSLAVARGLAGRQRASLRVVHAVPDLLRYFERTLFPYAGLGDDRMEITDEVRKNARRDLVRYHHLQKGGGGAPAKDGEAEPTARQPPFEVEILVGKESCGARLADRLASATSELVVVGRCGRDESQPGRIGSVSGSLCAASSRPVLVTRATETGPVQRVIIALDLSPHSTHVLRAGIEMAVVYGVKAELVVVTPPVGFGDVNGIVGRAMRVDHKGVRSKVRREVGKGLDRLQQDLDIPYAAKEQLDALEVVRHIAQGDPVEELLKMADAGESDLLVVGAIGQRDATLPRNLGRVAQAVVASAPCHVLVVPAQ
jgi:nucleotide-binding universal stress UspA family protein